METVTWLWLYDKRWMFGAKAPNLLKIWAFPLILNSLFLGSLLYYSFKQNGDILYPEFKPWIDIRMYLLIAMIVDLLWILLKASSKIQSEDHKLGIYHKANLKEAKKYNYWLRRRIIISFSGLILLVLGVINWFWTLYGMNLAYLKFQSLSGWDPYVQYIIWGNLLLTGVFSFPVIWIMFWMIFIKGTCLVLSVIWPSALISIKKLTA